MSDFSIRPATPSDVAEIAAIYSEAVLSGTATFEIEPPSEAEMGRRLADVLDGGHPYLVAEALGTVVGYSYAGPYHRRPAYRSTIEDSVYLSHGARGKGIGQALLAALITESEARGFRQMIAIIGDSGNAASIRLHRSAGFTHVGTFKDVGYKFGRWLDTVLMQRSLGPGRATPTPGG